MKKTFLLLLLIYISFQSCDIGRPVTEGEYHYTLGDISLYYKVAGRGPLILVQCPGWGIGSEYLQQSLHPLEKNFTLVYYDTRGSGYSSRDAAVKNIDVGQMVEDLESLRKHLHLKNFILMGHSHGGYIAMNYSLKYTDRVSKLILLDTPSDMTDVGADVYRNTLQLQFDPKFSSAISGLSEMDDATTDEAFNAAWMRALPLYFYNPDKGMKLWKEMKLPLPNRLASTGTYNTDKNYSVINKLESLKIPTLIVVGNNDFITTPFQAAKLHESIKKSQMKVIDNCGHFPWMEQPEEFYKVVKEFLE